LVLRTKGHEAKLQGGGALTVEAWRKNRLEPEYKDYLIRNQVIFQHRHQLVVNTISPWAHTVEELSPEHFRQKYVCRESMGLGRGTSAKAKGRFWEGISGVAISISCVAEFKFPTNLPYEGISIP